MVKIGDLQSEDRTGSRKSERTKRKQVGCQVPSDLPALPRLKQMEAAALAAAYGTSYRVAARDHNLPVMSVFDMAQRPLKGELPPPPTPVPKKKCDPMVSVINETDKEGVLNSYGVFLSGKDGKVPRNNKKMVNDAMMELRNVAEKGKWKVTRANLLSAIKHHETMRSKHKKDRGTSRDPYEGVAMTKQYCFGRPTLIPYAVEFALAQWIIALRAGKFPVNRGMVLTKAQVILRSDDAHELNHLASKITHGWYYRFLGRWHFGPVVKRDLDVVRAKWCTSANMKIHYDCLMALFIANGLCVLGEDAMGGEELTWVKPELVASIDETRVGTAGDKEKSGKTLGQKWDGEAMDNGECFTYKGSKSASLMAGTFCDFTPTPTEVVLNSGATWSPDWTVKGIPGCRYHSNEKGSFTEKFFENYIKGALYDEMVKRGLGAPVDASFPGGKKQRGVLVMDGVITHCGWGLIQWCNEHHLDLVLRPPNTTSISQPEDVILFKQLKKRWYEFKDTRLQQRVDKAFRDWEDSGKQVEGIHLTWGDFFEGLNSAYQLSFLPKHFESAWRSVGVRPFTRSVEKNLREKEKAAVAKQKSKADVKMVTVQRAMALINDSMQSNSNLEMETLGGQ